MLCYSAKINVNDTFNKDILISLFLEWLMNTRNKMEGLSYHNESVFSYEVNAKKLNIEDFSEENSFVIHFTTRDNYKRYEFNVEIIYNYSNQSLLLNFYKKTHEDSRYINAITLPRIFVTLLTSPYILKDADLKIKNEPFFMNKKAYYETMQYEHTLPIVILTRNKKCLVNPYKLSEALFGIAHVICLQTSSHLKAEIIYPNGHNEDVSNVHTSYMKHAIYDKTRLYNIEENLQYYNWENLSRRKLENKHFEKQLEINEFKNYFNTEIENEKKNLHDLKIQYNELIKEKERLLKQKEDIVETINDNKEPLMSSYNENIKEKHDMIIEIILEELKVLPENEYSRRKDVLTSIVKGEE